MGLAIAGYLSFVAVNEVRAVCGPMGDCNTVQQSAHARLLGVIPIAVLGIVGYGVMVAAWLVQRFGPTRWRGLGTLLLFALALSSTLFSGYLTFLEPFVIGATWLWYVLIYPQATGRA